MIRYHIKQFVEGCLLENVPLHNPLGMMGYDLAQTARHTNLTTCC